jgi:DNA-binding NarL/FixJ family response regulator
LASAIRRHRRHQEAEQVTQLLEGMLESRDPTPRIIFDEQARPIWASSRAQVLIEGGLIGPELRREVRTLLTYAPQRKGVPDRASVTVRGEQVLLRLHWDRRGRPVVVAELKTCGIEARLAEVAQRHGLTQSEARVLEALSRGLSNEAIAASFSISVATVKTHIHRVLAKLGVKSRLQAAVLINGSGASP